MSLMIEAITWPDQAPLAYLTWVLFGCAAAGGLLLWVGGEVKTQLGVALITGAVFAAAAYLAQKNFERQSYLASLSTAGDLPGFDDLGQDLTGATLASRDMRSARLLDARLNEANLADTSLVSADLTGAHLEKAVLFHTRFSEADMTGADLSGANIRGAKFDHANLGGVHLDGAHADLETCWPLAMASADSGPAQVASESVGLLTLLAKAALVPSGVDDAHLPMKKTIGHVCEPEDSDPSADRDRYRDRVCVDGTVVTVERDGPEATKSTSCEKQGQ